MLQEFQAEVNRVAKDPPLHVPSSSHKLAILYLVDALCSQTKPKQRPLGEELRTQLRVAFGRALPSMVQHLATPCNCLKVRACFSRLRTCLHRGVWT